MFAAARSKLCSSVSAWSGVFASIAVCLTKASEPNLIYYLPKQGHYSNWMQTAYSMIWTRYPIEPGSLAKIK